MDITRLFNVKIYGIQLLGEAEQTENGYKYEANGVVLKTEEKFEDGITVRSDSIKNVSASPITVNRLLSRFVFNGGEYEVYTQYSQWCKESSGVWQPLSTGVFASSNDVRLNNSVNPFLAVYNLQNQRGTALHIMADSLWQYKVYKSYTQGRQEREVYLEAGFDDLSYVLQPNEELKLPVILYYTFKNKLDMDAYKLHNYCNNRLKPRLPVIYNSWMGVYDNVSVDILMPQLEKAKYIGCEYFVIDAGWFGEPYKWFNMVGDWQEATDCQMAGRMAEFADTVRSYGLKFGLWFEIERASLQSKAVKEHPEYYIIENGNAFVDFGNKDAESYIYDVLSTNIRKYDIQFIKFDFNARLSYDKDDRAFIDYYKGYRSFIRRIKEEFPDIYLENCASGGMRMALKNLEGFDSFWISDNHSLNVQLEIYKNTLLRMPCNVIEKWVTIGSIDQLSSGKSAITVSGDFGWGFVEGVKESFLRAIMLGGPIGISCDLTKLRDEHIEILKETVEKHKNERSFWQSVQARILGNTESFTCIQYNDEASDKIKLFLFFKRSIQNKYVAYPVANGKYRCGDRVYDDLNEKGIEIDIPVHSDYTATVVELDKIKE